VLFRSDPSRSCKPRQIDVPEEALLSRGVFDGVEGDLSGFLAVMARSPGAPGYAGVGFFGAGWVGGAVKAGPQARP
jgi:hypothetical protein